MSPHTKALTEYNQDRGGGRRWSPPTPDQIKKLRKSLKLSQAQFAEKYGISITNIKKWETGASKPETVTTIFMKMLMTDNKGVDDILSRAEPAKATDALELA